MFDVPPPAPPIVTVEARGTVQIQEWEPGIVRCGAEFVQPARLEQVLPVEHRTTGSIPRMLMQPVTIGFRIDASGRPLSIGPANSGGRPTIGFPGAADIEPALARSSFPAGAKADCRITYTPRFTRLEEASPDLLVRAGLFATQNGEVRAQIERRLAPPGATCPGNRALPRTLVFPEVERIARGSQGISYTSILFDIDGEGRPVNLRPLAGSGSAELDAEFRRAITASRFGAEPRTGCIAPFAVRPFGTLQAPPMPALDSLQTPGAKPCSGTLSEIPDIVFPRPFQQRGIEGWAVIRYSVAPWGEVGGIEVVAAQPAHAFGESARNLIRRAKAKEGPAYAGCLQRVVFELPDKDGTPGVRIRDTKD